MRIFTVISLALLTSTEVKLDEFCDGVDFLPPNQFCCGGKLYYDPEDKFECCLGDLCRRHPVPVIYKTTTRPPPPVRNYVRDEPYERGIPEFFLRRRQIDTPDTYSPQHHQPNAWDQRGDSYSQPPLRLPYRPMPSENLPPPYLDKPKTEQVTFLCGDVDMIKLRQESEHWKCCGDSAYDSRYFTCKVVPIDPYMKLPSQQTKNSLFPVKHALVTLPTPVETMRNRKMFMKPPELPRPVNIRGRYHYLKPKHLKSLNEILETKQVFEDDDDYEVVEKDINDWQGKWRLDEKLSELFYPGLRDVLMRKLSPVTTTEAPQKSERIASLKCLENKYYVPWHQVENMRCCMSQLYDIRNELCKREQMNSRWRSSVLRERSRSSGPSLQDKSQSQEDIDLDFGFPPEQIP